MIPKKEESAASVQRYLFPDFDTSVMPAANGPLTLLAIIDRYLGYLALRVQAGEYSAKGFLDVRRDLLRFAAAKLGREGSVVQGTKLFAELRRQDLLDWIALNTGWRSNATRKRNLAEICACFAWAEDEGIIDKNPYHKPRGLKLRTRRRPDAQPSHYIAFMRKGSRSLRRILFFLWNSGARPCEARELEWPMLHLDEAVAILERHKTVNASEEHKPRIIGLEPRLVRFLRNLERQRLPDQQTVFVNGHGECWTKDCLQKAFWRCRDRILRSTAFAKKYGVHKGLTVYCIRHGYVTEGIMAGVGERQMADQIGHTSTNLIGHYSHAATKARHLRNVAAEIRRQRREARKSEGIPPGRDG